MNDDQFPQIRVVGACLHLGPVVLYHRDGQAPMRILTGKPKWEPLELAESAALAFRNEDLLADFSELRRARRNIHEKIQLWVADRITEQQMQMEARA